MKPYNSLLVKQISMLRYLYKTIKRSNCVRKMQSVQQMTLRTLFTWCLFSFAPVPKIRVDLETLLIVKINLCRFTWQPFFNAGYCIVVYL
jgi:hypothetical protein